MDMHKRATVVVCGARYEAIITASSAPPPSTRSWSSLPTVVTRDGEPLQGVVWSFPAADVTQGFLHAPHATDAELGVLEHLTRELRDARPRASVVAEARESA